MQKYKGIKRIIFAFKYSAAGISYTLKKEAAFRQELFLSILLFLLLSTIEIKGYEKAILAVPVFLMLIVELLNTSIETVVNRIGLEKNYLSGVAKDIASAAVLLSIVCLIVVWWFVLYPYFSY